jgi:hypothetical protein
VRMWNNQLVTPFDPTLELDFENPVPEDVEAKINSSKAGTNLWMTIDETREEYGLDPLPDGQGAQLYVNVNQVPLSVVYKATEKPAPVTPNSGPADTTTPQAQDGTDETAPEGKKSLPKLRR